MDRRLVSIGRLGPASARPFWKRKATLQRLVRGALLAVLVTAVETRLSASDPRPAQPEGVKAGEAGNIMWRFDGNGRFPNIRPPTEWRQDRNILWKTAVEVGGHSSPIVARDRVFVTAEMGSLICLDVADGKVLWRKDLFSKGSKDIPPDLSKQLMRGCGGDSKQSTPTPTSNGELVFYINAMGLCACYDLQGNQKWIRIIETAEDEDQFTSSPIFVGDRIVLSWGCLVALDAKTGRTLWKAADTQPTHGTPVIAKIGGENVVITPAGAIVRLEGGEVLCHKLFKSKYATPLIEGNMLYVIDVQARALELPARAEKGMRPKEVWTARLQGELMASPVYRDGLIYTIDNQQCRLHIIDAKTGEVLTANRVVDEATKAVTPQSGIRIEGLARAQYVYASPVASERNVFFFDDAGNTALIELGRKYKLLRVNKLEDGLVGTPFFFQDRIIIRGTRAVYCIRDKNNGK
jgi:outer membrane protein assembly factor BamB